MEVAVTGGAGYIGSHLSYLLKSSGFTPVVFDNLSEGFKSFVKWGDLFEADLRDYKALETFFKRYKIEAVFHLAADAIVSESMKNPAKYYENNLISTINLLKAMIKFNIRYLIFSSSCSIFGNPESLPLSEDHKKSPISPYGKSKLMIENILKDYSLAYGINFASLRYFNAAGAAFNVEIGENHKKETHLIPLAIRSAINGSFLNIYGNDHETADGTAVRDYIHVLDLADAHIKALKYIKEGRNLFLNLGAGIGYSILDIIKMVEKHSEKSIKKRFLKKREGDPEALFSTRERASNLIDWRPKYSLDTIIESAINWHKKNIGEKF